MIAPISAARVQELPLSRDEAVKLFVALAEKPEYGKEAVDDGVTKWVRPIRYAIIGGPSPAHTELVREQFRKLSSIVPIDIQETIPLAPSGFRAESANYYDALDTEAIYKLV